MTGQFDSWNVENRICPRLIDMKLNKIFNQEDQIRPHMESISSVLYCKRNNNNNNNNRYKS